MILVRLLLAFSLALASLAAVHAPAHAEAGGCALHMAHAPGKHAGTHAPATPSKFQTCCLLVCFAAALPADVAGFQLSFAPALVPADGLTMPFGSVEPAIPPPRA